MIRCADVKDKVEHPPHWHIIRAGGITVAQGQCEGYPTPGNSREGEVIVAEVIVADAIRAYWLPGCNAECCGYQDENGVNGCNTHADDGLNGECPWGPTAGRRFMEKVRGQHIASGNSREDEISTWEGEGGQ